jgi:type IV secretory pathway VirB10-like protein
LAVLFLASLFVIGSDTMAQTTSAPARQPPQPVSLGQRTVAAESAPESQGSSLVSASSGDERLTMIYTGLTAAFTGLLVLVGAGQLWMFWRQLNLMRRNLEDGTKAANAAALSAEVAKESAETAQRTERAFLTVEIYPPGTPLDAQSREWLPDGRTSVSVNVHFFNHGKTPAIIRAFRPRLAAMATAPTNVESEQMAQFKIPPSLTIRAGADYKLNVEVKLNRRKYEGAVSGSLRLFCFGTIRYDDVFGKDHETGFCWERTKSKGEESYGVTVDTDFNFLR